MPTLSTMWLIADEYLPGGSLRSPAMRTATVHSVPANLCWVVSTITQFPAGKSGGFLAVGASVLIRRDMLDDRRIFGTVFSNTGIFRHAEIFRCRRGASREVHKVPAGNFYHFQLTNHLHYQNECGLGIFPRSRCRCRHRLERRYHLLRNKREVTGRRSTNGRRCRNHSFPTSERGCLRRVSASLPLREPKFRRSRSKQRWKALFCMFFMFLCVNFPVEALQRDFMTGENSLEKRLFKH